MSFGVVRIQAHTDLSGLADNNHIAYPLCWLCDLPQNAVLFNAVEFRLQLISHFYRDALFSVLHQLHLAFYLNVVAAS